MIFQTKETNVWQDEKWQQKEIYSFGMDWECESSLSSSIMMQIN